MATVVDMEVAVVTVGDMEVAVATVGDMEVAGTEVVHTVAGTEVVGTMPGMEVMGTVAATEVMGTEVAATEGAVVPMEGVAATWETISNGPKSRCLLLKSSHSFEHRPPKCSLDCL